MKPVTAKRAVTMFGALLILAACADSSVSSRDQITPTYLFYTTGTTSSANVGVWAVDPGNPGNPIQVIDPAAGLDMYPTYFLGGAVEPSRGTLADLHYKYLVTRGGAGNNFLFRIATERTKSLVFSRVSSEANASAICAVLGGSNVGMAMEDYANPDNSVLFYVKDPDVPCTQDADDVLYMVRLGMGSGTAPLGGLVNTWPVSASYNADGSIAGFLVYNATASTIELRDLQLANPVVKLTGVTAYPLELAVDQAGRTLLAVNDNDLHLFDPSTQSIGASRYTKNISLSQNSVLLDSGYAYFQDDQQILRLPMDGSATATVVADESAGTGTVYDFFQVSRGKLVYWHNDSGGATGLETLRTVPVTGGTPQTLFTLSGAANIRSIRAAAGRIYLSLSTPVRRAVSVNDDGTNLQVEDNAWWSGFTYHPRQNLFADRDLLGRAGTGIAMARMTPDVIYRIQFLAAGGGNSFSSFDADTTGKLAEYGVPATDFGPYVSGSSFPPVVHGLATNQQTLVFFTNAAGFVDALFLHARDGRSAVRVTNSTDAATSTKYYGVIGGCSLGNGRVDPLLPALILLASLYLWRRRRRNTRGRQ